MFELINPKPIKQKYTSKKNDVNDAAKDIWGQLSKIIKKTTDDFYFTIKKDNKIYNFKVDEKTTKDGKVEFIITPQPTVDKHKYDKELIEILKEKPKQVGGKFKFTDDDSSSSSSVSSSSTTSSSSSDEDLYYKIKRRSKYPSLVYYYPTLYKYLYGIKEINIPNLISTDVPYNVKIVLPPFDKVITGTIKLDDYPVELSP